MLRLAALDWIDTGKQLPAGLRGQLLDLCLRDQAERGPRRKPQQPCALVAFHLKVEASTVVVPALPEMWQLGGAEPANYVRIGY